jgi:hypothetical protein
VPPWPTKCVSLNAESQFEGMEFHDLACPACAMPSVWGRTAPLIETAWAYAASRSKGGQRGDCDRLESFQRTYPLAGDRVGRHGLALSHGRRRNGVPLVWARTNGSGTRVAPRYDRRRRRYPLLRTPPQPRCSGHGIWQIPMPSAGSSTLLIPTTKS